MPVSVSESILQQKHGGRPVGEKLLQLGLKLFQDCAFSPLQEDAESLAAFIPHCFFFFFLIICSGFFFFLQRSSNVKLKQTKSPLPKLP